MSGSVSWLEIGCPKHLLKWFYQVWSDGRQPLGPLSMPSLDSLVSLAVLPGIFHPGLKLWKARWYLFLDGCVFKMRLTHIKKKKKKESRDPFLTNSTHSDSLGLPRWLSGKKSACQHRRREFNAWVRKISWRRKQPSTPVFLLGKSLRSNTLDLGTCCRWGAKLHHHQGCGLCSYSLSWNASSATCSVSQQRWR